MNIKNVEIILRRDHIHLFLKACPQKSLYGTNHDPLFEVDKSLPESGSHTSTKH